MSVAPVWITLAGSTDGTYRETPAINWFSKADSPAETKKLPPIV